MKRWIKWIAGILGLIVLLLIGAAMTGKQLAQQKRTRQVAVTVAAVPLPTDAASLERGRYLFLSRGCAECHGANGGGREFIHDGKGMRVAGPNISAGAAAVAAYRNEDWVRTIRHGVKPNGQPVFIMPSEDFNRFTDADLGALIAYVQRLAPVPGGDAVMELPLPVQVLYGFGLIPDAAQKIDHSLPPAQPVAATVSVEHGAYVANMCIGCHGAGLVRRQDSGRASGVAGCRQPDARRGQRHGALQGCATVHRHAAQRNAPGRQCHPGDAV